MSAQTFSAGVPNGTDSRGDGPVGSSNGAAETDAGVRPSGIRSEEQRRDLNGSLAGLASSDLQDNGVGKASPKAETVAVPVQAEATIQPPTMLNTDGRSGSGTDEFTQHYDDASGGYVTPQSGSRMRATPPWWTAVEVPKWMMRLGSMLQHPSQGLASAELAPSPLPSGSPLMTSPPGGQPFRLRSPTRVAARAIPPTPTPPSSSSIPQEAIQAEVERQLQGVMVQLREYGEANQRLHVELLETRAKLRAEQERAEGLETISRPRGLLDDLGMSQLDPGPLPGLPEPREYQPYVTQGQLQGTDEPQAEVQPLPQNDAGSRNSGGAKAVQYGVFEVPKAPPAKEGAVTDGPSLLRSWWDARPRRAMPPPRSAPAEPQGSPVLEALARGVQQLQELQVKALEKASTTTTTEQVKPGTLSLTPLPSLSDGADSALTFQDWMEMSAAVMSDISESSGNWWMGVISLVEETYVRWLASSPLERLGVEPTGTEIWCEGKWQRVNARASSMLLSSMPTELRADMVSRRCAMDCVKMLFHLYKHFQPGGSAERQDVLKRLQTPGEFASSDTLEDALKVLRAWPRWMDRCKAVQMTPPDPSVLARGLQSLTAKHIDASPDASFRTSMLRTTLRLDARPSPEQVAAYQKHLQAELEVMQTAKSMSTTLEQPKLRAVESGLQPKARDASGKPPRSTELCRYFAKASGCKRGDRCTYSHSLQSFDKETRAKKCLRCGAEGHRQRECPVGKAPAKSSAQAAKETTFNKTGGSSPTSTQSTMATIGTATSGQSAVSEPVQGTAWTLETLVQAAQQMVQNSSTTSTGETSPEKTRPEVKVINLCDIRVCSMNTTALLDSGATHSLRNAVSEEEWLQAEDVAVQLAGRHQLMMKITAAGTLLMPFKGASPGADASQTPRPQTIVPMGQLIKTLGYSMVWTPESCELVAPDGERRFLQVDTGCPQLQEMEALALIARLEDRKVEQLRNSTLVTQDQVGVAAMAMDKHWNHYLYDYVVTGSFESGLRAVRDAPFFQDLPGDCLEQMIPSAGLRSGWDIMKQIGWLSRAQRRRLWSSKRWIVHLFAGVEGHWEIMRLDKGDAMVVELDLGRCAGQDLLRSETWRMLLWGAVMGKVDVIMGGPPDRVHQHCRGGERDTKALKLVARMMWLFVVAQVGREVHGVERDVGFILEYPEGTTQQERDRRSREVEQMEEAQQVGGRTNEAAGWYLSRAYWETVQRPRWEDYAGVNTVNGGASFWETRLWKFFQREAQTRQVSFDQGAMGGSAINRTTLGTNIHSLLALNELRVPEGEEMPERSDQDFIWSPGLVNAIVVAVGMWYQEDRCVPRVSAMTPMKWKQHVDSNHAEYRKDCATCVMARGVGRQHRKVHHPESYTLTADVAGPLNAGLDATSKGTMGKNLRYLLVAKYLVPKQFIHDMAGKQPPEDHGVGTDKKDQGSQDNPAAPVPDGDLETIEEFFKAQGDSKTGESEPVAVSVLDMTGEDPFEEMGVEEELSYEPSEVEDAEAEGPEGGGRLPDVVMQKGDCEPPDMTYLTFATALPNNRSGTVRQAVQDVSSGARDAGVQIPLRQGRVL